MNMLVGHSLKCLDFTPLDVGVASHQIERLKKLYKYSDKVFWGSRCLTVQAGKKTSPENRIITIT